MSEVNRSQLAGIVGKSVITIDAWVKDGMPYVQKANRTKGKNWLFDTAKCIEWLIERNTPKSPEAELWEDARARDRSAVADMRELQLKVKLGQYVPIETVIEFVSEEYAIVKSSLRAIPARISQKLLNVSDIEDVKKIVKTEIDSALIELSEINENSFDND